MDLKAAASKPLCLPLHSSYNIRLPARLLCPFRLAPTVAPLCNAPSVPTMLTRRQQYELLVHNIFMLVRKAIALVGLAAGRPISLLRLPGKLLLGGLSWDRGTSLYDELGGITLSLRCWFRPATSRDFFLRSAFSHSSFLGFRRCVFQGFHCGFDPGLGDR